MDSLVAASNGSKLEALARSSYGADLSEAELRVLHDSARPSAAEPDGDVIEKRHVRGDFLRWLVNDSRVALLIDSDGLQVTGATIDGAAALDNVNIPFGLNFQRCIFSGQLSLQWAKLRTVLMTDSVIKGDCFFTNAVVDGSLIFGPNFQCDGSMTLDGVKVNGDLDMVGAALTKTDPDQTLGLSKADIKGGFFLERLRCAGPVVMVDAKLGSEVLLNRAQIGGDLLMAGSTVAGSVMLDNLQIAGNVGLDHTQIGGTVYLGGSQLNGAGDNSLFMRNAVVDGDMYLVSDLKDPSILFHSAGTVDIAQATFKGVVTVSGAQMPKFDASNSKIGNLVWTKIKDANKTELFLNGLTVKAFVDTRDSWPAKGKLHVKGFTYDELQLAPPVSQSGKATAVTGSGAIDPSDRIEWLKLQSDADQMNSQPWLQLAKFVKERGNVAGSKRVIFTMERIQAAHTGVVNRSLTFVYDVVEENPLRLFVPVLLLWLFGWVIFWRARRMAAMAPSDPEAFVHFEQHGAEPSHYPPFSAAIYSLENVLPVVKLGQDGAWGPNPSVQPARRGWPAHWVPRMSYGWLATLRWMLIVVGWVLALILAAAIGDQFKAS